MAEPDGRVKISVYIKREMNDWLASAARERGMSKSAFLALLVYDARERERTRSLRGGEDG